MKFNFSVYRPFFRGEIEVEDETELEQKIKEKLQIPPAEHILIFPCEDITDQVIPPEPKAEEIT